MLVKITVSNDVIVRDLPTDIKKKIVEELTLPNPKFSEASKRGYSTYRIPEFLYNFKIMPDSSLKVPRGMKNKLESYLNDYGVPYDIESSLTFNDQPYNIIGPNTTDFRPYQRKYLYEILASGRTEGIIISPAGSGKTIMALAIMAALGQSTLWLTHRDPLIKQARNRFLKFSPYLRPEDVGLLQGKKWVPSPIITIGSVDSLRSRPKELKKLSKVFGLVILDEAHHHPAKTFNKVISSLCPYFLYGLTATPYRTDGLEKIMFQCIGDTIVNIPLQEVIDDGGIIMPTVFYRIVDHTKMEGNNNNQILKYLSSNEKRNYMITGDVVSEAIMGKRSIVISTRKEHCEELYKIIKIGWEKTGIVTGDYPEKHNDGQLQKLLTGEITVIVASLEKFGEGVDVDILDNAFLALPIRSEQDVEQLVGRIQRVEKNKKEAKLFDYLDINIGVSMDQFSTPTKNKECRLKAYQRLGLIVKPVEG